MTTEKLLEAIGDINSDVIRDAKEDVLESSDPKHRAGGRRLATILIVAALLLALSIAALAYFGVGDWFRSFFTERSGGNLSPGQQQYIDEKAVGIGQSMTCNGWTVTVESALCDGYSTYIKVNVEAPEGTVLDGKTYSFESDSLPMLATDEQKSAVMHSGRGWELLRDEDGKNNTITLLRHSYVTMAPGSGFSYTDGAVRTLRLENLCVWQDDKEVVVAEGVWSFNIVFAESDENETGEIELISEPVLCQGQRMMGDTVEVRITSFILSALGAVCQYEFIGDDTPEALAFEGVLAVMKDGSAVEARPGAGSLNSETNIANASFKFSAPIALNEVDYILFPDGTEISMPD